MEETSKDKKNQNHQESLPKGYQPSRFIQMRQQALLSQSLVKCQFLQAKAIFNRDHRVQKVNSQYYYVQLQQVEKKKFKPTVSQSNKEVKTSVQLTSFEKQQLFPIPAPKQNLKQQPVDKKKAQFVQPKYTLGTNNVQITLGGYALSQNLPQTISKSSQPEQQFELDEKKYLKPIQIIAEQNLDTQTIEEKNLKELLPPLAIKKSSLETNDRIDLNENLTLIQFPQKLPIKEQIEYYQNSLEKAANQKLPDFTQSQENKELLLKFLIKNCEQHSSSFTKLIPNSYCKKCFPEQQKGAFRLGKVLEYESGKVEIVIGGVKFNIKNGTKQDFVQEACLIQKPCNSENSVYELVPLGQIQNKLIVVPKFD